MATISKGEDDDLDSLDILLPDIEEDNDVIEKDSPLPTPPKMPEPAAPKDGTMTEKEFFDHIYNKKYFEARKEHLRQRATEKALSDATKPTIGERVTGVFGFLKKKGKKRLRW